MNKLFKTLISYHLLYINFRHGDNAKIYKNQELRTFIAQNNKKNKNNRVKRIKMYHLSRLSRLSHKQFCEATTLPHINSAPRSTAPR